MFWNHYDQQQNQLILYHHNLNFTMRQNIIYFYAKYLYLNCLTIIYQESQVNL